MSWELVLVVTQTQGLRSGGGFGLDVMGALLDEALQRPEGGGLDSVGLGFQG